MHPIIEIKNLRKVYRSEGAGPGEEVPEVRALDGVSLTIGRGDFVAVIGQSGSGKSTLMQILGLLDRKSSGEYFLDGEEISAYSDEKLASIRSKKIGFIFQFFNLLPRTTATDNVALPMVYAGDADPEARARMLLEKVGLSSRLHHKPNQLSGGQQQRVAIARALANRPQIIFADEPTGNISSAQTDEILNMLGELNAQGTTIVLVTHEQNVAERANRIITLKDGHVFSDERRREISYVPAEGLSFPAPAHADAKSARWQSLKENLRMAAVALSLNKMRTALATLGIVIGIGSVVAMVGVGEGAKRSIEEQLASLGTNVLNIWPINPRTTNNMSSGNKYRRFTLEDFEALRALAAPAASPISLVSGTVGGWVQATNGPKNVGTHITGAPASYQVMQNTALTAGRFYTEEEDLNRERVLLIGQSVVKNVYGMNVNPVGSILKINHVEFLVIGVLAPKGANSVTDSDDQVIVPLRTAMYRVIGGMKLENLNVSAKTEAQLPAAQNLVEELMRRRREIHEGAESDFQIRSLNEIREAVNKSSAAISSLLAAIASISLLVGGIGIMNVMLVSVKERTKEIGLRKALGARRKDVLVQFLVESVMICLLGGAIGLALGYGLSLIATFAFGWAVTVPISAAVLAFVFSLIVGVTFGLWPAKQASNLSPIEALRYE